MGTDSDDINAVFRPLRDYYTDLGRSDVQPNDEFFSLGHCYPPGFCESPLATPARRTLNTSARTAGHPVGLGLGSAALLRVVAS
ncbi:MAG: hypothetical protein VCC68_05470, partial [Myxococcota bacterium]